MLVSLIFLIAGTAIVQGDPCNVEQGKVHLGGNIFTVDHADTAAACQATCDAAAPGKCGGGTYLPGPRVCELRNLSPAYSVYDAHHLRPDDQGGSSSYAASAWVKNCHSHSGLTNPPGNCAFDDSAVVAHSLIGLSFFLDTDFSACVTKCKQDGDCYALNSVAYGNKDQCTLHRVAAGSAHPDVTDDDVMGSACYYRKAEVFDKC